MMKRGNEKRTTARPDELLYKFPRTRGSGAVTCLAFGKDRRARYPGYFFCHGCDLFEDAILSGNKRAKRTQQNKYACRIEIIQRRFFGGRTTNRIVLLLVATIVVRMMLRMKTL